MITVSLPKDMDELVSTLAAQAQLSKKTYVLKLLEQSLEDEADALMATARLERIDKGIDIPVPLEDIVKKYRDKYGSANLDF